MNVASGSSKGCEDQLLGTNRINELRIQYHRQADAEISKFTFIILADILDDIDRERNRKAVNGENGGLGLRSTTVGTTTSSIDGHGSHPR